MSVTTVIEATDGRKDSGNIRNTNVGKNHNFIALLRVVCTKLKLKAMLSNMLSKNTISVISNCINKSVPKF